MSLGESPNSHPEITTEQFADDYYNSLQSLTFNSRPIIESHTSLAQENSMFAPQITAAIEKRIDKAIPSQKLFALYLLDSISKNIGLPYTSLFSNNIFKTFTKTYGLVDDQTRCKLIKLFKTWKLPTALTGLPLFDSNQLDRIEQFLIKVTAASNPGVNYVSSLNSSNSNSNSNSNASTPNSTPLNMAVNLKPNLIKETDDLLALVSSRLKSVPSDEKGQQRHKLLNQLKSILSSNSSIPKSQLDEVAKQLQSIREDEILKLNILRQQHQQQQQQQQQQQKNTFSASQLQNLLNFSKDANDNGNNGSNNNNQPAANPASAQALFNMMSSVIGKNPPPANSNPQTNNNTTNPLGLKDISFLQNILKKTSGQQAQSAAASSLGGPKVDFKFIRPTKEAIVEDFTLTQSMVSNHNPTSKEISLLYDFKPIQCSKCPRRFASSPEGDLLMKKHIEWHERVEQRLSLGGSGLGGVVNRSWYLTESAWVEFDDYRESDERKQNASLALANTSVSITPDKNEASRDHRDRHDKIDLADAPNYIVRIPESSSNEVVCGICREKLVGIFDEDSGDWIWRNAVEQKGKVWHWTCWEETKRTSRRDRSPQRS